MKGCILPFFKLLFQISFPQHNGKPVKSIWVSCSSATMIDRLQTMFLIASFIGIVCIVYLLCVASNQLTFNNFASMGTTIVDPLIRTTPIAGLNIKEGYSTPAAKGIAIKL